MEIDVLFSSLPDTRRGAGRRHKQSSVLWMLFLGICSGYIGYRSIAKFMQSNASYFKEAFDLKHGVPSDVTVGSILKSIDKSDFKKAFNTWCSQYELEQYDWVSGDGQVLSSTVSSLHDSSQDLISMVSLFCQKTGLVYQMQEYRSKKKNEAEVLRQTLLDLKDKGLIITLDALHCQKNCSTGC